MKIIYWHILGISVRLFCIVKALEDVQPRLHTFNWLTGKQIVAYS